MTKQELTSQIISYMTKYGFIGDPIERLPTRSIDELEQLLGFRKIEDSREQKRIQQIERQMNKTRTNKNGELELSQN